MKSPLPLIALASGFIILPLIFLAASCEATKPVTTAPKQDCDSIGDFLASRVRLALDEADLQRKRADAYRDTVRMLRTVQSIKDVQTQSLRWQIQRNIDTMNELKAILDNEREQRAKIQAQLDSAVAIKNRLDRKLSHCNCQPSKP